MSLPASSPLLSLATILAACAAPTPASPATPTAATVPTLVPTTPAEAAAVVAFWRDAGPALWFAKDPAFDQRFRERFARTYDTAARGGLRHWTDTADGALALVIVLDQYPRNSFRGTPRMYATDALARRAAATAIAAGHDRRVAPALQLFFYLPYGHSEDLADQEQAVDLCRRLGEPNLGHAIHHRDIIRRFGRFPHRNPILGRAMTADEQAYLDGGGYRG
jgi:uncharacterized protein (DUF924 family)